MVCFGRDLLLLLYDLGRKPIRSCTLSLCELF